MKWLLRLFRKLLRLAVASLVFTVVVVVLDALLSPDGRESDRPA